MKTEEMVLQVGRLPMPTPTVGSEVPADKVAELRPLDWSSLARIVGQPGIPAFVEALVDVCWDEIGKVALIYANNPDKWPARSTFRDDAHARGTVLGNSIRSSPMTPLERIGLGEPHTHELQTQIRVGGKFTSLDELNKRIPRTSLPFIKAQIKEQIVYELTQPGPGAMFFARLANGKTLFHGSKPTSVLKKDDDDEGFRPPTPSRYR